MMEVHAAAEHTQFGVEVICMRHEDALALRVSHALCGVVDSEELLHATQHELLRAIPADDVLWVALDLGREEVTATRVSGYDPVLSHGLATFGVEHAAIQSYLVRPDDLSPRTTSQVADRHEWLEGAAYRECFAATGERFQLSLVVQMSAPRLGLGWTLTRTSRDFDQSDLAVADALLPVLTALHGSRTALDGISGEVAESWRLTPRETEVATLIADGLSAHQAARLLRISERTVHKHLEHAYGKLGCHDRVSMVNRLRAVSRAGESCRAEAPGHSSAPGVSPGPNRWNGWG